MQMTNIRTMRQWLMITLLASACVSGWAQAQLADTPVRTGEILQFKFTDPGQTTKTQKKGQLHFKESGDNPKASNDPTAYPDSLAEKAPYLTYVGYPRHAFSALTSYIDVGAQWSYNGEVFNFSSPTAGFGAAYEFIATPRLNLGAEYFRYTLAVSEATVGQPAKHIQASEANYDNYSLRLRYCFFGNSSFFHQFCPGVLIGNTTYPVLNFVDQYILALGKVPDLVVGINLTYRAPLTDRFSFRTLVGYNHGTGMGNSGTLTSKSNSSYFVRPGVIFEINPRHSLNLEAEYKSLSAKLSGKVGFNNDTWITNSTEVGARLTYSYTL